MEALQDHLAGTLLEFAQSSVRRGAPAHAGSVDCAPALMGMAGMPVFPCPELHAYFLRTFPTNFVCTRHHKGKEMLGKIAVLLAMGLFVTGCASVPMANKDQSDQLKLFAAPPEGQAGIYIYRDSNFGAALKKDIWIDGKCVGESAPKTFFHEIVAGDQEHTISTESEFSPNDLKLFVKSGVNYFIRQSIKMGVFVGGARLTEVQASKGEDAVKRLSLAEAGTCSK